MDSESGDTRLPAHVLIIPTIFSVATLVCLLLALPSLYADFSVMKQLFCYACAPLFYYYDIINSTSVSG